MKKVGSLTNIRLYKDPNASLSPDVSSEAPVTNGGSTDLAPDHNARVRVPASFPRSDVTSWSLPASSSDEVPSSNSKLFLVSEKTGGASSSLGSDISKSMLVDWSSSLLYCWNNLDLRILLHRISAEAHSFVACDTLRLLGCRCPVPGQNPPTSLFTSKIPNARHDARFIVDLLVRYSHPSDGKFLSC